MLLNKDEPCPISVFLALCIVKIWISATHGAHHRDWEALAFPISMYGGPSTKDEGAGSIQNGEHLAHYLFRLPDAWNSLDFTLPMCKA